MSGAGCHHREVGGLGDIGPGDDVASPVRPVVWSVAGSDCGAGAGLQADLRSFDAFGVFGCTAVAAITAQSSVAITQVAPVPDALLDAQLDVLADDMPPAAIKTGLLGSAENVRCVARRLERLRVGREVALVIDPVWRASVGTDLAASGLRAALTQALLPMADAITPNRAEAAWLLGLPAGELGTLAAVEQAAAALRALGPRAVVITGGDAGGSLSADWIDTPQARGWLTLPRLDTRHQHGTGCVHAASLASALALGFCAADAAVIAKLSTTAALHEARAWRSAGAGAGAVRPLPGFALRRGGLPALHDRWPEDLAASDGAAGLDGFGASRPAGDGEPSGCAPAFAPLADRRMGLYAVVDSADAVRRVLAAGVRTLQLRIKAEASEAVAREIHAGVAAARAADAQLFINDHWALALQAGAYGVHLGQEDLAGADLAALRAAGLRLGVSSHAFWEVCRARALRPSYIACGPIHATDTKAMPWWPQGTGNLAYWCSVLEEPVVAIAGMDAARSHDAARAGASGVAVLRGLARAADLPAAVGALAAAIGAAARAARWPPPALPRSTLRGPVAPPGRPS